MRRARASGRKHARGARAFPRKRHACFHAIPAAWRPGRTLLLCRMRRPRSGRERPFAGGWRSTLSERPVDSPATVAWPRGATLRLNARSRVVGCPLASASETPEGSSGVRLAVRSLQVAQSGSAVSQPATAPCSRQAQAAPLRRWSRATALASIQCFSETPAGSRPRRTARPRAGCPNSLRPCCPGLRRRSRPSH
jgi:hypothetical protein